MRGCVFAYLLAIQLLRAQSTTATEQQADESSETQQRLQQRSFVTPPPRSLHQRQGLFHTAVRVKRSCQRTASALAKRAGRGASLGTGRLRSGLRLLGRLPNSALARRSGLLLRPGLRVLARRGWVCAASVYTPLMPLASHWRRALLALSLVYVAGATLHPALQLLRLGGACAAPRFVCRAVARAAAFQGLATFAMPALLLLSANAIVKAMQPAANVYLVDWAIPLAAPLALLLALPHLDAPTEVALDELLRRVWPLPAGSSDASEGGGEEGVTCLQRTPRTRDT